MSLSICPLAKAVHHVRRARRHLADGNLGASIFALYTAGTWLGFADGEDLDDDLREATRRRRRSSQVRLIVGGLALDLGALVDVRCALMVMPVRVPRGSVGSA